MSSRRSRQRTSLKRLGELERYGLMALVAALFLALGFLAEELRRGRALDERVSARVHAGDREVNPVSLPVRGRPVFATPGGGEPSATPPPRTDFDFFEPPVRLPGRPWVEPPPPPTAPYGAARNVAVRKGDTLQSIARRELGSSGQWQRLLQANPGVDPRRLRVGQVLELPGAAKVAAPTRGEPLTARFYEVARHDTLERISLRYYGTRSRWIDILEANRDVIQSPERLRIGARIRIP